MSNAIERIKGYCCEVNKEQWEELVRVAHQNGVNPSEYDYWDESHPVFCVHEDDMEVNVYSGTVVAKVDGLTAIPFPDFRAKLKGAEEWTPKAGEMVEYLEAPDGYEVREYAGYRFDTHLLWATDEEGGWVRDVAIEHLRPLRQTITRAEAEKQLGKRIID